MDNRFSTGSYNSSRYFTSLSSSLIATAATSSSSCESFDTPTIGAVTADLPASQAALVERLVNSSIMTTQHYRDLTTAHIAGIGKGKGY